MTKHLEIYIPVQMFNQMPVMPIDTPKIRKNVDLIYAFSGCPMGEPLDDCPFVPYYKLNNEQKQIMQIEPIPKDKLDRMRVFHRNCVQHYHEKKHTAHRVKEI